MKERYGNYFMIESYSKIEKKSIPKRWIVVILGFFGAFNIYAMRVNLSVAMVAMVQQPVDYEITNTSSIACKELIRPIKKSDQLTPAPEREGDFEWSASTQAVILGSFFYGYVITQIPGGNISEKYGAKWLLAIAVLTTSVFTLITPFAAWWGVYPLIFVRIIEGLSEGVTFPALYALVGRWAPKVERSRMSAIIVSGSDVGSVVTFALSGLICATLGWPFVFYIFGILGIIWTAFWLWLVYETPESHPSITEEEIKLIQYGRDDKVWERSATPWKSMLTSKYVWAMIIVHFGLSWGFYTFLTELPTYMARILHFDIKRNGVLSALPYLVQATVSISICILADKLRATRKYKINTIRKFFNSIASFCPALCVGLAGYVGCQPTIIIGLLIMMMAFSGFSHAGFGTTHIDMSPEFAGKSTYHQLAFYFSYLVALHTHFK
ncbi:hypothetical protein NPIL_13831 [Nephila pilipes]|uniref:Sialin n=1 Tax=Nephila pilipes TaxID=299642 RepID=A0A8X6ICX8_NEPPI|nr:hypothetical protein NPIL_244651 [Nephila pilipes]GFS63951.1 hypothetical protein NPIL_13831 [Nephila pilipes]